MSVPLGWLERRVNEIRNSEKRLEGETVDEFMRRTWHRALLELEQKQDARMNETESKAIENQHRMEVGLEPLHEDELTQESEQE